MLWLKTYRVKLKEESCIKINIGELDGVSSTKYIYLANSLCYTKSSLF